MRLPRGLPALCSVIAVTLTSCSSVGAAPSAAPSATPSAAPSTSAAQSATASPPAVAPAPPASSTLLPGMPPPLSPTNVYAADQTLSAVAATARALVYVPNNIDSTVSVIDQQTMTVIGTYPVGPAPQHVVPSYDLKTLYATSDRVSAGGSLTPFDPNTGLPGAPIPVADPYNLYFTPDGRSAIAVAEELKRLDFYDPHTWQLQQSLPVPTCAGVNHMDFTADGKTMLFSCEFSNHLTVVDVASRTVVRDIALTQVPNGKPQDVKLSPDGKTFYVADLRANGVYLLDGQAKAVTGFVPTGSQAHGLYINRDATKMYVTNRGEASIRVIDLATRQPLAKWVIPGGGTPDMGNINADGTVFWVSGRGNGVVYAISTVDGHLIKKIAVGRGPHALSVWPQPGRYSLGYTGILR